MHSEMKQTKHIQPKLKPQEVLSSIDKDRYSRLYQPCYLWQLHLPWVPETQERSEYSPGLSCKAVSHRFLAEQLTI